MSRIGNLAILASAGSGKTFRLAHRYIRLLADEQEVILPDRICAMTFTRKAAGEIFDDIAMYLREAAGDDEAARLTATERIDMPQLKQKDFLGLLRRFVDNMHRARIGTLDSFIVGIAKAFPFELGIPVSFQVMDSDSVMAAESRQEALSRILAPAVVDKGPQKAFLQAFKQATFGHEEKAFGDLLDKIVKSLRTQYRLCPDGERWGSEELIWGPKGRPFKGEPSLELEDERDLVMAWAEQKSGGDLKKSDKGLYPSIWRLANVLGSYGPASAWDDALSSTVAVRLIEQLPVMKKGGISVKYGRKDYQVDADVCKALYKMIRNLFIVEFNRAVTRTTGLFNLLDQYEQVYDEVTKGAGRFTFTDVQYLLARPGDPSDSLLTRDRSVSAERLYIDYRLDCRLDHWLIDEFQDTSDLQWAIFSGLVDEVVQAPPGTERSLFCVGDAKQAIYRWRGGNHELFGDVLNYYGDTVISSETMAKTRRCAQPIVDAVNKVFRPPFEGLLAEGTDGAWADVWEEHETAVADAPGYVTILEPVPPVPGDEAAEARCVLVADLLKEIQPVERGLEVGILVRTNDGGKQVANILRRECRGMPVVHEGASAIVENELVQALLALVTLAAHPGDEFAWKYVQMTPFANLLKKEGISRSDISQRFLKSIYEDGFQAFVHAWGEKLQDSLALNEYGMECLTRLEEAAGEFDATGSRDCTSFVQFAEGYTVREQTASGAIRVMTVHQAKGLEFDMVILPELQSDRGRNMGKAGSPDLVRSGTMASTDWILRMPRKIIAEQDAVLTAELEKADVASGFDSLCLLYVAMTRPKHGLYMISSMGKSKPASVQPADFLRHQLAGDLFPDAEANAEVNGRECARLYESDPDEVRWYEKDWPIRKVAHETFPEAALPEDYADKHDRRPVLRHREPSRQDTDAHRADHLFKGEGSEVMEFGTAIHELFQEIEWVKDAKVDDIVENWDGSGYSEAIRLDVVEQFRACVASETVAKCLSKPDAGAKVWLEKHFEVLLKGEFVSGAFDRVTIKYGSDNRPVSASIVDYKSSRVESDKEVDGRVKHYKGQMDTYREALSKILGLDNTAITCVLLFTRCQKIRTIE